MEDNKNSSAADGIDLDTAGLREDSPGYSYIEAAEPSAAELQETYDRYVVAGGDRVKALERYIEQLRADESNAA